MVSRMTAHASPQVPPWLALPRSAYIHVPFCRHHCGYCDFTVIAGRDRLIPEYLDALQREVAGIAPEQGQLQLSTLFIGGGTPTQLPAAALQRLFEILRDRFDWSADSEVSVEANPDGLTPDRLQVLADNGVNRLSLGVQSFDSADLQILERTHTPETAITAVEAAATRIGNVSLDLIFAVPGQSFDSWCRTLDVAVSLPVQHVSTYGLTYEAGTPYFRRERSGELRRAPDELERSMYLHGIDRLSAAGFEHYEVSNFARPGRECRHNQVCWSAEPYFAAGPGAARYVDGIRSQNHRSVSRWMKAVQANESAVAESEQLAQEDRAREAIMLALRTRAGLHVPAFERTFSVTLSALAGSALDQHLDRGLLEFADQSLRLTRDGLLLADTVVADFL
jgi:oxygen-independent coproporphyrinogen-3 oxidase